MTIKKSYLIYVNEVLNEFESKLEQAKGQTRSDFGNKYGILYGE